MSAPTLSSKGIKFYFHATQSTQARNEVQDGSELSLAGRNFKIRTGQIDGQTEIIGARGQSNPSGAISLEGQNQKERANCVQRP